MKIDDIVIRNRTHYTELKYRVTSVRQLGIQVLVFHGIRVKWDKNLKDWVSFGKEKVLLQRDYRLFTNDDYHYLS